MLSLMILCAAVVAGEPQVLSVGERISIDHMVGDVSITSSAEAQVVTVEVIPIKWAEHCMVEISEQGQTAVVRTWSEKRRSSCQADIRVVAPRAIHADVEVGVGDLIVREVTSLVAEVGVGDLQVAQISGEINIELGNGDVAMELMGTADIEVGVGDIQLRAVPGARVDASVGVGKVQVLLPDGTAVDSRTAIGMGQSRVQLPVDPAATTRLQVVIGVGDILILPDTTPQQQ